MRSWSSRPGSILVPSTLTGWYRKMTTNAAVSSETTRLPSHMLIRSTADCLRREGGTSSGAVTTGANATAAAATGATATGATATGATATGATTGGETSSGATAIGLATDGSTSSEPGATGSRADAATSSAGTASEAVTSASRAGFVVSSISSVILSMNPLAAPYTFRHVLVRSILRYSTRTSRLDSR